MNEAILPYALVCGVPYELFWHLNPKKLEPYYEAQRIRIEAKENHENMLAWLFGVYTTRAIGACFSKNGKYPQKPIDLHEKPKSDIEKFAEYAKAHVEAKREAKKQGLI